ncbi:thiol reductant ABC exporter subunit CydD [Agromyces sp. ISL-38]|uniref:thiol reductant ABC exporter subunit CydD n=1 Tax=Agromyces sp. ISL-38 TaxID=2819107 RepID=UPI001BE9E093|nr:thiol reductant ABC exporter subunit CydD [Agromyces sp. ISL-38]MBT2498478.1 thiol reductant ABC exporter subunit CydD [Agromyces sp. ISL-38]
MKPLDPRLVSRSRAARGFLLSGAALALLQAGAMIAFAWSLTALVTGFIGGASTAASGGALAILLAAASVRALAGWLWEWVGSAGAMRVKSELRDDLLAALERQPRGNRGLTTARAATLLGPGLDALDEYFGRYLPQLVLTVVATPVLVISVWMADWVSGLILVIVLPLIPLFMALIGMATGAVQRRQWQRLESLSKGFLEVVGGLSTLMVFGRAERQVGRIRDVTEAYRASTMKVLRVTFLSGFTLELAGSLSVALVAVSIGLRLVAGDFTLAPGLFVLVLAPEVFLPIRNVGAAFHASTAGLEASRDALDALDQAEGAEVPPSRGADPAGITDAAGLRIRDLRVIRDGAVVLEGLSFDVAPGEFVVVTGDSGSGKSSLLSAILGFADLEGEVTIDGVPVGAATRSNTSWAGQAPQLLAGTIAENVRLGQPDAAASLLEHALRVGGVDLPGHRRLGPSGAGLSGGQAQRVATARAVHRLLAADARLLLLDEPSSALDADRELELGRRLRELAREGRAVLVTTHRPGLAEAADRTVPLSEVARV